MKDLLIQECVCGDTGFDIEVINGIECKVCTACKIVRQMVPLTIWEYENFYKKDYHGKLHNHDIEHDIELAEKRLDSYEIRTGETVLDVGSGNGAFVKAARDRDIKCYGVELARGVDQVGHYVYEGEHFENIHFPTEHLDAICCHDVLEHIVDLNAFFKECQRTLRLHGKLIIDFPDFWNPFGKHHWRETQHLWMLRIDELITLANTHGFHLSGGDAPIPGKQVLTFKRAEIARQTIIVPPGIGDIYWALTKIRDYAKQNFDNVPAVKVMSLGNRPRSREFVARFPFVLDAGYTDDGPQRHSAIWKEAYNMDGRSIYHHAPGCDAFIAFNGVTRNGKALNEVHPEIKTEWFPPMFQSFEERYAGKQAIHKYGEYYVAVFSNDGMYKHWVREFPKESILWTLRELAKEKTVLVLGKEWDEVFWGDSLDKELNIVNLVGKTNLDEMLGILRNAKGCVGFPSGLTIMATVLRCPTVIVWNKYFKHKKFFWTACPSPAAMRWYDVADTATTTPDEIVKKLEGVQYPKQKRKSKPVVACVLRTGGAYTSEYVSKLKNAVKRHSTLPFEFVCLSDDDNVPGHQPFHHDWPGWWSKLELFRNHLFDGRHVVYFDLDTLITGNIDPLLEWEPEKECGFAMLKAFRRGESFASGVMTWRGDFDHIHDEAVLRGDNLFYKTSSKELKWDQHHIQEQVSQYYGLNIHTIQDIVNVRSLKRHVMPDRAIGTAQIVCFHGQPRPHKAVCLDRLQWVKEHWK